MQITLVGINAKYIHTNLAIRYLKAYVQPQHNPTLLEFTIKDPVINIATEILRNKPNIVGFSCYIWNIEHSLKVAQIIKKVSPTTLIFLGGPEVSYDSKIILSQEPYVDLIIYGEGEKTFKDLCENYNNLSLIKGIVYRSGQDLITNPPQDKINLDTIPSPFYFEDDKNTLSKRISYIETSRGCPFNCQYCLSSTEVGMRFFDKERVKTELMYLMENGSKTIKFLDRTFNTDIKYALEIFSFLIKEHKPGCVFQFEITGDILKPEIIDYLNENAPAGLFRFEIGIQSTNELTNKIINRRQNFEKLRNNILKIKNGGKIDLHLDLIAGLPEEDYNSFRKTFNDVFEMKPEELQLGFLKMLRGTEIREYAYKYDYKYLDFQPYEILQNNVLSFEEVIKIKQVEDVLEKYWNSGKFSNTLNYLIEHSFASPWDFFQEFGTYWENQGWSKIGHQHQDLFFRLFKFLSFAKVDNMDVIESMMKIDYYNHYSIKPKILWWKDTLQKKEKNEVINKMIEEGILNETLNYYLKNVRIEPLSFNYKKYNEENIIETTPSLLLIEFDPTRKSPTLHSLRKS
jgi:radical SAM superfamily enzyme YgiQ (UPF0313 family)